MVAEKVKTLFNAIIKTSHIPSKLNASIVIPIIKDKSKTSYDKNNYRPISVSNVFAQILEKIILIKCPNIINSISSSRQIIIKTIWFQEFHVHPPSDISIKRRNQKMKRRRETPVHSMS